MRETSLRAWRAACDTPAAVSSFLVSLLERAHGHLGWLAAAALAHPAWLLGKPGRRAPASVIASSALVTAAGAAGAWLYGPYRERVRQPLFAEAPRIGWLFERKEHLALGAVLLAWCGALAHLAPAPGDPGRGALLEAMARRAFRASFLFALLAALFGTVVAAQRGL